MEIRDILRRELKRARTGTGLILGLLLACAPSLRATESDEQFAPELAGARMALPATHSSRGFWWADAFLGCKLPLSWSLTEHLKLQTRMDFEAGWLERHDDTAATAAVGPVFVLNRIGWPVSFESGSSSTLISRHDFGDLHLGTPFQFTTHVGINWVLHRHFRLTYRFEHMSNAGIAKPNPGVNLHAIALAYLF